jgi:hypothetical protein
MHVMYMLGCGYQGCTDPAFPAGPFRGPDAKQPLQLHPPFTCAACPDRALPRHALLRADAADCRWALGPPPATRGGTTGISRGCAPEGTALKWPVFYLSALMRASLSITPI